MTRSSAGWLRQFVLLAAYGPVLLFLAAGDLRWTMGWAFAAFAFSYTILSRSLILRRNPDLIEERAAAMTRGNVEPWDRLLVPMLGMLLPTATIVLGGLDHRFGWTPRLPWQVQAAAYVPIVLGAALSQWAAMENAFFSAVVRIQEDRGHVVVASGPYRFIRHPGYAGSVLHNLFIPVALGSLWAGLPAAIGVVLTLVRTALEDRTLARKLPGYREFARRTRWRLVPGVW